MRARRWGAAVALGSCLALLACGADGPDAHEDAASSAGAGGDDGAGNADGDCLTDAEEAALGTDPNNADSDGDGVSDCDEIACVSDPSDGAEQCYTCGWKHNDPGDLVSTGNTEGSVIANGDLLDGCGETVPLWDFAGEYHILFMTAAW